MEHLGNITKWTDLTGEKNKLRNKINRIHKKGRCRQIATRNRGKFTDLVNKEITMKVFDDGQHE